MDAELLAILNDAPKLASARAWLVGYGTRTQPGNAALLEQLACLKEAAVQERDEPLASAIWCLEQIARAQDYYLAAFADARRRHFYSSWCQLELAEIRLGHLRPHFDDPDDRFGTAALQKRIEAMQGLFPYRMFFSPGLAIHEAKCSICAATLSLRSSCGHKPGELYGGEMAGRLITKWTALEISMVDNPVQKYSVGFPHGVGPYNYALVDYLVQAIAGPWTSWSRSIEKRTRPTTRLDVRAYRTLGRNDLCACGSGKKFKRCCLDALIETYDHHQFAFDTVRNRPPEEVPDGFVSGLDDPISKHAGASDIDAERNEILDFIAAGGRRILEQVQ